jgi:putative Mn2+ efflux pump MntP
VAALLAIVLPLGLDTFALSIALGASGLDARERLRVSAILAAFEGGMPLIGLALGRVATSISGGYAEIAAGLLLIIVGLAMLFEDAGDDDDRGRRLASAQGFRIIGLGLSIALDELAVGVSLGLLDINAPLAVTLIAAQALIVAQIGLRLGTRLGDAWGERAEKLAGLALAGYGAFLLLTNVTIWKG